MSTAIDVALVGAGTPAGEQMLERLAEMDFPLTTLYPLADAESAGNRVVFGDQSLVIQDVAAFDFSRVQVAFFLAGDEISEKHIPVATAAGCVVIDSSNVYRDDPDIPMVVPEVNPEAIAGYGKHRIIACPTPAAVQLSIALKPIQNAAGLIRVHVCGYHAVSDLGQTAVEELARQTALLLNARPIKGKVFPKQITFNVIPQVGEFEENGYTCEELALIRQTRRVLGEDNLAISATAAWVPVFYGHSQDIHVETREKLGASKLATLIRKAPGLKLAAKGGVEGYPTPVSDGVGSDQVLIGRIREDLSDAKGIQFWAVADNVRKGVVVNCIQIAQILIKEFL